MTNQAAPYRLNQNKYELALFIFRRDLRLEDNAALIAASLQAKQIIPCFIFDSCQVTAKNPYKSKHAIQFMIESLRDLERQLLKRGGRLFLFYGTTQKIVTKLLKNLAIEAVFINADYTPFSQERDGLLEEACRERAVELHLFDDVLINPPYAVKKQNNTNYAVFTAYWKVAQKMPVALPQQLNNPNFFLDEMDQPLTSAELYHKVCPINNAKLYISGGRSKALTILTQMKKFKEYEKNHNIAALDNTCLSGHLKFGTVSVREVFHKIKHTLGEAHPLLRQLYWRDFYTQIAFHAPYVFGHSFQKKYERLWWNTDQVAFAKWCRGETGFPLVDAGMRQLNKTGFMHNRVRMVVACFLIKDLHIDWQWGERYFARNLLDYDPAVNNGNWQWCASTGCDPQPWFRIFNPWLQQKKFDPRCIYIKRWINELKEVDSKIIHHWNEKKDSIIQGYPRPMVDHYQEAALTKKIFMDAGKMPVQ